MNFTSCFQEAPSILMEGAIGERLKREYGIRFDDQVAMAGLIYDKYSRKALENIFHEYISIAGRYHLPFMMTTPTRRANRERVEKSDFNDVIVGDNVRFLRDIARDAASEVFVGGLMGCRGDAYKATGILPVEEAVGFHSWQADLFKEAGVDFLYAGIMPALPEAAGMAKAMERTGLPYIISFMIRDNGRLIDGTTIHEAILQIDQATVQRPVCYMTNCVHPTVLDKALSFSFNRTKEIRERLRGIQANTSPLPPEELDGSCDLKCSDAAGLAYDMEKLFQQINLKILGGCCGTDCTHIEEIAKILAKRD